MPLRPSRPTVALLGIALAALMIRLAYLAQLGDSLLLSALMGDARQYDAWAQRIAAGDWIGTEVFYQTPLYPYALALVFKVAGHDLGVVRALQAMLGAASCVLLGLAGRRFFGTRAGLITALLLAVYPPAIFFDGLIQKSSVDVFLMSALLATLAEFEARPHWRWLVALATTTAVLSLNRENTRVLYPVLTAWLLFRFRHVPIGRRVRWTAVFLLVSSAVLAPVGLRNFWVGGEWLISTAQVGPNFFIGNNPRASGSYDSLVPGRGDAAYERDDARALATQAAGRPLSPGEVSAYWLHRSFEYIRTQPLDWIALTGKKLLLTFNAAEISDTESIEAYAESSWLLRALGWFNFGVVFPLAVLGGWVSRRHWPQLSVLYGIVAGLALAVAAFYVVARYRHPLVPVLLLFAGAGVGAIADLRQPAVAASAAARPKRSRGRASASGQPVTAAPHRARTWMPGLAAAALAAVVSWVPMKVVHDQTYGNLGAFLVGSGRPGDAIPVLQRATAMDPTDATPHFNLGRAYRDTGSPQRAIESLRAALALRPDDAEAHALLGLVLREVGTPADALPHLREAARLRPGSVEAQSNLGLALMEAGDLEQAIAAHRRAIALAPAAPNAHNNLGGALRQAGDTPGAIQEFREALRLDPNHAEAHANLAVSLAATGEIDQALREFDAALRAAAVTGRPDLVAPIEEAIRQTQAMLTSRPRPLRSPAPKR